MQTIWAVAQTYPTEEAKALRRLQSQKYEAFFPYFFFKTKRGVTRLKSLFPGYLFVRIREDQLWMQINYTDGIRHLLTRFEDSSTFGFGPGNLDPGEHRYKTPWAVPDDFIAGMSKFVVSTDVALGSALNTGMRARVKNGIFSEHEAVIKWRDGARLALLFSIMGKETEVEFHISEVDPV